MSWELMSYGELMSGGTNVLDSMAYQMLGFLDKGQINGHMGVEGRKILGGLSRLHLLIVS